MNKIIISIFLLLNLLPSLSHAEWMSDVDKKYQQKDPVLYSDVLKAKTLISDANGQTELNTQALELLKSVLNKNPKFAPAYVQYSRVISNLGYQVNNKFDGAALSSQEDYLKKAINLEPNYDYAIAMMGFTKMFQGNLDEAEKYYIQAAKMKSGYPWLKSQMAQLATKRGDYKKSIQLATEGYEEHRSEPKIAAGIINELIFAYERMEGNHNKELEFWQTKRTDLDPSVAWSWGDHAKFRLYFLGDYKGAIKYGEKALSLMDYGVARYIVAGAYYKKWADLKGNKSNKTEADEAWNKANNLYPDTTDMIQEFYGNPLLKSTSEALALKNK
ncbi:MAG: hypothetical protein V4440_10965 [Pseudomonadota bacterium]